MAARTKVIPPFGVKRVYLLCVLIGALFGLLMQYEERWAYRLVETEFARRHLSAVQMNVAAGILTLAMLLLPCVLAAVWLACLSQRRWQAAAAGAVAGAGEAVVSLYGGQVLWSVHGGAEFGALEALELLIPAAILAALGAGTALLVRWLVRAVLFTTVEQDGSRCPRCGYQLGSEVITLCPGVRDAGGPVAFVVRAAAPRVGVAGAAGVGARGSAGGGAACAAFDRGSLPHDPRAAVQPRVSVRSAVDGGDDPQPDADGEL